ncbi:RNA 2',3'-cyclic phosphodiesterase [bacterium]|nr:RNA 2',3'-cyclic phosphodiesterase [bacterium]
MTETGLVRAFIALETSPDAKQEILSLQEKLRTFHGARVSWVRSEGVHLTLKFLGDVKVTLLRDIEKLIEDCASRASPFEVTTTVTGGFPNLSKPRVLWVGLDGGESLGQLQMDIDSALSTLGFERERKRFHPHLTIGRVKSFDRGSELSEYLNNYDFPKIRWMVDRVRLMSSILKPGGAEYRELAGVNLRA